jgi:hypothetical protein
VFLTTDISYYSLVFGRALLAEHFKLETRDEGLVEVEREEVAIFTRVCMGKKRE